MARKANKYLIILAIIIVMPAYALALDGVVAKVDVCRGGNVIFKTTSGWYVTARYLSGVSLKEGDKISGNLKTFGIQTISKPNRQQAKYYILDFKGNRFDAINAHCRSGFYW
jgi:hypothetical protein